MGQNFPGDPLIHQNPPMLRVILELDDVEMPVVCFDQVRLSAAPHLSDEPARIYWHFKSKETITCPKKPQKH